MGARVSDGVFEEPPRADAPNDEKDLQAHVNKGTRIPRHRRKMFLRLPFGAVPGYAPICADSNDPQTQVNGILKRVGRYVNPPLDAEIGRFRRFVAFEIENGSLAEYVHPLSADEVESPEEWITNAPYPEHRKQELRQVYAESHGLPTRRECQSVSSFQKTESYEEFKLPRGINSRSDAFKVFSGRFFKAIEKALYKCPNFVKHVPVADRPEYIKTFLKRGAARYFGTDFSSFESGFLPELMRACECLLYAHMLRDFPREARLICDTIAGTNRCKMRCGVRMKVKARRMSGDMCTSLGNGFTNLMIFKYLMQGRQAEILVEGDDGLAAVYDDGPLPKPEAYAALGFSIKIEHVDDPLLASFCGCVCPGGVIVRDPRNVLSHFGWTSAAVYASPKMAKRLLRAKALSLRSEMPNSPLFRAIADRALYLTRGCEAVFQLDGYHQAVLDTRSAFPPPRVPIEARLFFEREYCIPVQQQLEWEAKIASADTLDFLVLPPTRPMLQYSARFLTVG